MELEEIEESLERWMRDWTWSLRRAWTWSLKGRLKESLELGAWSLDLECKTGRINSFLFFSSYIC